MKGLLTEIMDGTKGREVLIIRHGQTILNKENKARGWSDVPLDDVGVKQAVDLGKELQRDSIKLDGIVTSDLLRAAQTSLQISQVMGVPIIGTTKSLRPWNVGDLTGGDAKKAQKVMENYAKHRPNTQVGGSSGESFNVFKHRFLVGMIAILNSNRGLTLGFTSHSRGESILHGWISAGCPETLDIDLKVFVAPAGQPATAQKLIINSPLVLS